MSAKSGVSVHLLVTGGNGFVMSHVLRQWLERGRDYRVTSVDVFPADDLLKRFLAPYAGQVSLIEGSVTRQSFWDNELADQKPDFFIHGAAMTPNRNQSEKSQARTVVEVNIQGVLNALEWARNCASLRRMVHVSTGSIYGDEGPDGPLPEAGFEMRNPDSLYPITKRAGELLALRYRELFDLPLAVCRLSSIYGPMDRWTPGRDFQCVPKIIVQRALRGEAIRVCGADAIGDWLHAADVASGLLAMIDSSAARAHRIQHCLRRARQYSPTDRDRGRAGRGHPLAGNHGTRGRDHRFPGAPTGRLGRLR